MAAVGGSHHRRQSGRVARRQQGRVACDRVVDRRLVAQPDRLEEISGHSLPSAGDSAKGLDQPVDLGGGVVVDEPNPDHAARFGQPEALD